MDTTEKGVDYHYTWDSNEKLWMRTLITFSLVDYAKINYIPYTLRISSSAQGGQDLVSLSHTDAVSLSDLNPITAEFAPALRNRLNISNSDWLQFQFDMDGANGRQAYIPIITSTGEQAQGKLSRTTGFMTDIVGYSDLEQLIGKGVTQWKDTHGATFLTIVTGVDEEGNIHGEIAFKGDIRTLTDEQKRNMIFEIVGSILDNEDQKVMSQSSMGYVLAENSVKTRPDGTQDVGIVYNP